jgi:hypothetical protein
VVPALHERVLAWRGESSPERPDPYSAVVLTNFSWHWHGEEVAMTGERFFVMPLYPAVPLPEPESARIWDAVDAYGRLPEG